MSELPGIISVDDHVVGPKDLWTSRLPSSTTSDRGTRYRWPQLPILSVIDSLEGKK